MVPPSPELFYHSEPSLLYSSRVFVANSQLLEKLDAFEMSSVRNTKSTRHRNWSPSDMIHFDRFNLLEENGLLLRHRDVLEGRWEVMRKVGDCKVDCEQDSALEEFGDDLYEVVVPIEIPVLDILMRKDTSPHSPYNDDWKSEWNETQRRPNANGQLREGRLEVHVGSPTKNGDDLEKYVRPKPIALKSGQRLLWAICLPDSSTEMNIIVDDMGGTWMIGKLNVRTNFRSTQDAVKQKKEHMKHIHTFLTEHHWLAELDGEVQKAMDGFGVEEG